MTEKARLPGLTGVTAGQTRISAVSQDSLSYRGYLIEELAEAVCFEEVAHLLIYGELPTRRELALLRDMLMEYRRLPQPVLDTLRTIPTDISMMDVLRTTVSFAGHYDPVRGDTIDDQRRRSIWLLSTIASLIGARHRFANHQPIVDPQPGLSHAAQILFQCHGKEPDAQTERLVDYTLVLCAEHDFSTSTFAARVIGSTGADMLSAVVGAIGALNGPLHGCASEQAMEMLSRFSSPEEAAAFIHQAFEKRERIYGFGHGIYKKGDHRARLLERQLRTLAERTGRQKWLKIYDAVKKPMIEERGIHPNVEYPCGLTYHLLGIPKDLYTPLCVASRVVGWCAHFIEQVQEGRIYRPRSEYVGEPIRPVPPMETR